MPFYLMAKIHFIPNIKREAKSNLKLEPNIRKQGGLKAEKNQEGTILCSVQNVHKTLKKQELISNIMSPILKIMAELQVLQMSKNCIDVTKVFCLVANKLLNLFVPQVFTCLRRTSLTRGFEEILITGNELLIWAPSLQAKGRAIQAFSKAWIGWV